LDRLERKEIDSWEAQSVAVGEARSVVAEGRQRELIDEWRAVCDGYVVETRHVQGQSPVLRRKSVKAQA